MSELKQKKVRAKKTAPLLNYDEITMIALTAQRTRNFIIKKYIKTLQVKVLGNYPAFYDSAKQELVLAHRYVFYLYNNFWSSAEIHIHHKSGNKEDFNIKNLQKINGIEHWRMEGKLNHIKTKDLGERVSKSRRENAYKDYLIKCNETGDVFFYISQAAKAMNIKPQKIGNILHETGNMKSIHGYTFSYIKDNKDLITEELPELVEYINDGVNDPEVSPFLTNKVNVVEE